MKPSERITIHAQWARKRIKASSEETLAAPLYQVTKPVSTPCYCHGVCCGRCLWRAGGPTRTSPRNQAVVAAVSLIHRNHTELHPVQASLPRRPMLHQQLYPRMQRTKQMLLLIIMRIPCRIMLPMLTLMTKQMPRRPCHPPLPLHRPHHHLHFLRLCQPLPRIFFLNRTLIHRCHLFICMPFSHNTDRYSF